MRSFPLFFGLLGVAGALASGTLFVACSDGGSSAGGDPNRYASASHALTVGSGGGVTLSVPPASDSADPRVRSLIVRAAAECGVGNLTKLSNANVSFAPSLGRKRVAFAGNGVPFESSSGVPVATCDERLEEAEALVCMADRFAAIADAVGELHWNETPSSYATGAVGGGVSDSVAMPWTIPPQAERDRFIARDLAFHMLALAARVEATPMAVKASTPGEAYSCGEIYAAIDARAGLGSFIWSDLAAVAFDPLWQGSAGDGYMPISPQKTFDLRLTDTSAAHAVAHARVAHELKLLRVTSELTKRLVTSSVAADTAGAAAQAARASDTRVAGRLQWGETDAYDSLAHAGRTLFGRTEVGAPSSSGILAGDPACSGVVSYDVAKRGYAGGTLARIEDPTLESAAQLRAANLAQLLGVAADRDLVGAVASDAASFRDLVFNQLVAAEAARSGQTLAAVQGTVRASAWRDDLATLSPADLLVGLDHAWSTLRMRMGATDEMLADALKQTGAYRTGADADPFVTKIPGALPVRDHVLARSAVWNDTWSRTAGLGAVGSCVEPAGISQAFGVAAPAPGSVDETLWRASDTDRVPRWLSQDPFSLAQFLERRVTVIGSRAGSPDAGEVDVKAEAARVAAAARAWAGPARLFVSTVDVVPLADPNVRKLRTGGVTVELHGATPGDLGFQGVSLSDNNPLALASMSLLYGFPYEAECAVRGSGECPGLVASKTQSSANAFTHIRDTSTSTIAATRGVYDLMRWTFPYETAAPVLQQAAIDAASNTTGRAPSKQIYVLGPDPAKGGALGILGIVGMPMANQALHATSAIPATTRHFVVSFPLASLQRSAADRTLSLPSASTAPQAGGPSAGNPAEGCMANAEKLFVPLENDMIQGAAPGEDSWRYWIDRAEKLAAEADQRANELLTQRLSVENRKENAAGRLSAICGTTAAVSRLSVQNNQVSTSGDTALDACLGTSTVDVVTFGPEPSDADKPGMMARAATDLGCATANPKSPLCTRLISSNVAAVSFASLGLSESRLRGRPSQPQCGASYDSLQMPVSSARLQVRMRSLPPLRGFDDILDDVFGPAGRGFDANTFHSVGGDMGYSGAAALGMLRGVKVRVENDATWKVSSAGEVRLASDDARLWPGCLRTNACNPTNDVGRRHAIRSLNSAFRRCSDGKVAGSRTITDCEGLNASDASSWRAVANDILWRVEGAVWFAQVAAGGVQAGAFDLPIPVFNGASAFWGTPPSWNVPAMLPSGIGIIDYLAGLNEVDVAAYVPNATLSRVLGSSSSQIPTGFFLRALTRDGDRDIYPLSLRKVYPLLAPGAAEPGPTWNNRYLHVRAVNPAYASDGWFDRDLQGFDVALQGRSAGEFDVARFNVLKTQLANQESGKASGGDGFAYVGLERRNVVGSAARALTGQGFPRMKPGDFFEDNRSKYAVLDPRATSNPWLEFHEPALVSWVLTPDWDTSGTLQLGDKYVYSWDIVARDKKRPASNWGDVPQNARVRAFANTRGAWAPREAAGEYFGAFALACALPSVVTELDAALPPPPDLSGDITNAVGALAGYAKVLARRTDESLGDLYLVNVASAIANRVDGNPSSGTGQIAEVATAVRGNLIQLREAAAGMADSLDEISAAIESARIDLALASNNAEQRDLQIHMQRLTQMEQLVVAPLIAAKEIADSVGRIDVRNPLSAGMASLSITASKAILGAKLETANATLETLDDVSMLSDKELALQQNKILHDLYVRAKAAARSMRSQLAAIRSKNLEAQQNLAKYQSLQAEAREAAAIASGAREVIDENGQARPIPLNVVNDRLEEGNFRRYQEALARAKQAAFYARRAFEQKIGMPLTAIYGKVGGYEAPATWVDSVCRSTGINYKAFRSQSDPDGGLSQNDWDKAQVGAYVDSWIGDYVSKFRAYADALLVQYPFTSGDDVALLSMRSQLLGTDRGCTEPTRNRVTYSGSLDRIGSAITNEPFRPVTGWQIHPCSASAPGCLQAKNAALVNLPSTGDAGAPVQRDDVTWLQELAPTAVAVALDGGVADAGVVDGGVRDGGATDAGVVDGGVRDGGVDAGSGVVISGTYGATPGVAVDWPKGWISQATALAPGNYRVTFKDLALDAAGNAASSSAPFSVAVFGADSWGSAALSPQSFTPTNAWTDRAVYFTLSSPGAVRLAFRAAVEGSLQLGSVALANVQIEKLDDAATGATAVVYQRTQGSLMVPKNYCNPQNSQRFRELFTHDCTSDGRCYWELATPFRIPVSLLSKADLPEGTPGRTRYNHRLGEIAFNVVGTGVRDCTGVADYGTCASAQSVDYTLEHDGSGAELWSLDSPAFRAGPYAFDFGLASLSGRAIAAERNFTYLSTSDRAMAFAGGVGKSDFDGRPIDARTLYRLRIWDSDSLRWDRIDDIQVLFTYRYWTKLTANGYGP